MAALTVVLFLSSPTGCASESRIAVLRTKTQFSYNNNMEKIDNTDLERWTERVHTLLEDDEAKVTWNDYVCDPDNKKRKRQVDVTIRRDGIVTHVECRAHSARQDVKWIEELMGRRESLGADSMIAVSASGFTEGARKKAARYGIMLRTMSSLTDKEILSWAKRLALSMSWLKINSLQVELVFSPMAQLHVTSEHVETEIRQGSLLHLLLDSIKGELDPNIDDGVTISGTVFATGNIRVAGWSAHSVIVEFEVERSEEELTIPAVFGYASTGDEDGDVEATIGRSDSQGLEIVRAEDKVNMILDLSNVRPPDNCHMIGPHMKSDREITLHMIQLVQRVWPPTMLERVRVGVRFENQKTLRENERGQRSC